jgi:hypothetical protein
LVTEEVVLWEINQIIDEITQVYILSDYKLELLKKADKNLKNGSILLQKQIDEKWKNGKEVSNLH